MIIRTPFRHRGSSNPKRRPLGVAQPDAAVILAALALPVIVIDRGGGIRFVNPAGEQFFGSGAAALWGSALADLVAPHSPLLALVDSVWRIGNTISEYDILLEGPRFGGRLVTIQGALTGEGADTLVLTLHERSMAEMMDRHLTHRNAARSITGMAAMLAHEVKNPLSGIRGAAQLLEQDAAPAGRELTQLICDETDRIVALVDRMEAFSDHRPIEREVVARALDWLLSAQSPDGSWCEWHGVKRSPEAAGYALYVALSSGVSTEDPRMRKAVEWLVATQEDDGGWAQEPGKSPRSCNWVTQTVVMGLKASYLAARQSPPGGQGAGAAFLLLDFDTGTLDELSRPRDAPLRAADGSPESAILRLSHANVLIVSACSGHGFKFASAIGEASADLVTDQPTAVSLAPFTIARFG